MRSKFVHNDTQLTSVDSMKKKFGSSEDPSPHKNRTVTPAQKEESDQEDKVATII